MTNLYWPVYKNLEKEVISLSETIHMDDHQLGIYSVKIADLLIRCSIEIESISKKLFFREGGRQPEDRDLYFDTDCLELLEEKWLLSRKKVVLSSSNFHFEEEKNRILAPLHKSFKRGSSGANWKKGYQAVKHERVENLKLGNIRNLLAALGGLYILNIYFKAKVYDLDKDSKALNFPISGGSDIFALKLHRWAGYDGNGLYQKREDFDECIYLTKWKSESERLVREANQEMQKQNMNYFLQQPRFIEWLKHNKLEDYKGIDLMWDVLGQEQYVQMLKQTSKSSNKAHQSIEYEGVLNEYNI